MDMLIFRDDNNITPDIQYKIRVSIENSIKEARILAVDNATYITRIDFSSNAVTHRYTPIQLICRLTQSNKNFVRLVVTHSLLEKLEKKDDRNWLYNNSLQYIVECYVGDDVKVVEWCDSDHYYSALVKCNYKELQQTILDILLDIEIEKKVVDNIKLSAIYNMSELMNRLSMKKVEFCKKENIKVTSECYCSFAYLNRMINNGYKLSSLYDFWLRFYSANLPLLNEYLQRENVNILRHNNSIQYKFLHNKIYKISDEVEFIKLLSSMNIKNINKRRAMNCFKFCHSGVSVYVQLKKSIIGLSKNKRRQVMSILGPYPKIGKCAIIPEAYYHTRFRNIMDLFSVCTFEKYN